MMAVDAAETCMNSTKLKSVAVALKLILSLETNV